MRAARGRADVLIAVGVLVAGAIGLGAVAASAGTGAIDPASRLAAYDRSQSARDALPADFPSGAHGDGGLIPSTSRFLGTVDSTSSYWVVQDRLGHLCLVLDDVARGTTGAACGEPDELADGAITLSVSAGYTGGYQAFLLSDQARAVDVPAPWIRAGANLIAIPLDKVDGARLSVADESGAFDLVPFPISR